MKIRDAAHNLNFATVAFLLLAYLPMANGAEEPSRFLGAATCSSTGCHGGAAGKNNQFLIWSSRDFHSRSHATLTSARSERFAEVLKLGNASTSERCAACHAPFHAVPESNRLASAVAAQGVSCESCHAPAENWIRAHTRPDFTHEDRVAAGMRDLKNLYVRANSCVACHQTLDPEIAAAGHPELIFELDGQGVSEPKHWRESQPGPKAWLVGQAVAFREMSWQLSRATSTDEKLVARWSALDWLLRKVTEKDAEFPDFMSLSTNTGPTRFAAANKAGDQLARQVAEMEWTTETTIKFLKKLAGTTADFEDPKLAAALQARRAERLALALDRLTNGLETQIAKPLQPPLKSLFQLVQSLPTFDSKKYASALQDFNAAFQDQSRN